MQVTVPSFTNCWRPSRLFWGMGFSLLPSLSLGSAVATSRTRVVLMPEAFQGVYRGHLCAGGTMAKFAPSQTVGATLASTPPKTRRTVSSLITMIPWGIVLVPVPALANGHRAVKQHEFLISHFGGWKSEKGPTWPQTRSGQGCLPSQAQEEFIPCLSQGLEAPTPLCQGLLHHWRLHLYLSGLRLILMSPLLTHLPALHPSFTLETPEITL